MCFWCSVQEMRICFDVFVASIMLRSGVCTLTLNVCTRAIHRTRKPQEGHRSRGREPHAGVYSSEAWCHKVQVRRGLGLRVRVCVCVCSHCVVIWCLLCICPLTVRQVCLPAWFDAWLIGSVPLSCYLFVVLLRLFFTESSCSFPPQNRAKILDTNTSSLALFRKLGFVQTKTVPIFAEVHMEMDASKGSKASALLSLHNGSTLPMRTLQLQ